MSSGSATTVTAPAVAIRAEGDAGEAPQEQHENRRDGDSVEDREPGGAAVGPRHEPVQRGERPDGEVGVVRHPPVPIRHPLPVVVRDRERDEELGGGDPEARPDRSVGRGERDEQLRERERQERVGRDRQDVDADEGADEQAAEAVDVLHREARPAAVLRLAPERQPERDDDAEHDVRRDAGGARRVPDRRARAQVHGGISRVARAQASFSTISPLSGDEAAGDAARVEPLRPARRRAGSRSSRRRPRPRHVAPDAVTCSQGDSLGHARRRVDQVRAARGGAARRETAGHDPDRAAGRQRDVDRATHREVAADRDEAGDVERVTASSTASALTTPFRSSARPGGRESIRPGDDHFPPPAAQRRIDESLGLGGDVERGLQRAREELRDEKHSAPRRVHARQLRLRPEQAERLLPAFEHCGDRRRIAAGDRDVAAHGAGPVHRAGAHDVELATGGA